MLTRLRVQGFKSLHDVELQMAPLVVLMGPNAAGKSNLLEALLLLSRLATEQTLAAAFEPPLRGYPLEAFSPPESGLEGLLQQDRAGVTLEAEVLPALPRVPKKAVPDALQYRISVQIQPKTGSLEVSDELLVRLTRSTLRPRIERLGESLIVRGVTAGRPYQAPLGLNRSLLSDRRFTGESQYPDFDRLRTELSAWQTYYLDPRTAMREPQPPREVTDIGPRGEWIAPFLYRLKESETHRKYFAAIGRALRSAIPTVEDLDVDLDPRRGILDILIRQDGIPYSSRVVSEGTLRVLALCCLAGNPWPGELIAFEEPENGVHPRRIEVIADLLASIAEQRRSQVVVTTHSPTLIAAMRRRAAESPDLIKLFQCSQRGRATHVQEFLPAGPLFEDEGIGDSLTSPEDSTLVEAMLLRGWLDG
ncbi:MAG: AAA family ATPase [Thermoanaerobaculia bacterium]